MLAEGRDALARVTALYLAGHESFHCFIVLCGTDKISPTR